MTSPHTPTPPQQAVPSPKSARRIHLQVWLPIVIGLALAWAFIQTRNRYHDPRENALPAPKWDASAPNTTAGGTSTVDVPANVNLGGEVPLQIEVPQLGAPSAASGQNSGVDLGGAARLTGTIETESPTSVAEKPGLPWKR